MQELFSAQELQEKFSLDRITKSAAVFDKTKLSWMNGQYLRALPDEEVHTSLELLLLQKTPFREAEVRLGTGFCEPFKRLGKLHCSVPQSAVPRQGPALSQ